MELRQLRAFRAVALAASFTQAAARLHYAQSSVTAQVQALEADLGVRLFDRFGRRVVLTPVGQRLLDYAERLLGLAEEARHAVRADDEQPSGPLVVCVPESVLTYLLPEVLGRFQVRFPRVELSVRTADLELRTPDRGRDEGGVDLGFLLEEPRRAAGWQVEVLRRERVYLVAAPGHPSVRDRGVRLRPRDLQGERILCCEKGCRYRTLFERVLAADGAGPVRVAEFGSIETIKRCAAARLGVALLPAYAVAAELRAGQLVTLDWTAPPERLTVSVHLARRAARWFSPAAAAFWELTRELLGAPDDLPDGGARDAATLARVPVEPGPGQPPAQGNVG